MAALVQQIQEHWFFGVLTIFGVVGTAWALFWAYCKFAYRKLRPEWKSPLEQPEDVGPRPIKLRARHIQPPSRHPLKGRRVRATGVICDREYIGKEIPTMVLDSFPYQLRTRLVCEFPIERMADLHGLNNYHLIGVSGIAKENIQIGSAHGEKFQLQLEDCFLEQPPLLDCIKYVWPLTRIGGWWQWFFSPY